MLCFAHLHNVALTFHRVHLATVTASTEERGNLLGFRVSLFGSIGSRATFE